MRVAAPKLRGVEKLGLRHGMAVAISPAADHMRKPARAMVGDICARLPRLWLVFL